MKVAYVFKTNMSSTFQLSQMILPQLENGNHGVDVVGMFFFDDNCYVLQKGNAVGERLSKLAQSKGMLLMICDACAVRRGLAKGSLEQLFFGPSSVSDGTQNLVGALKACMGMVGAMNIKEMHQAEVVVAPSIKTEGKHYQLGLG